MHADDDDADDGGAGAGDGDGDGDGELPSEITNDLSNVFVNRCW